MDQPTEPVVLQENLRESTLQQAKDLLPEIYRRCFPSLSGIYDFSELKAGGSARDQVRLIAGIVMNEKIKTATHQRETFLAALSIVRTQNVPDERIDQKVIDAERCWFDDHLRRLHYMKQVIDNFFKTGKFE